MKKNLLVMLLAVIMVTAVIFIAAPATKAETLADYTVDADGNVLDKEGNAVENNVIAATGVLDMQGNSATVSVNEGVTLTIVDTKFMEGEWDLTGDSAGTLTVAEGSEDSIKTWEQFGDYKYLAVKNGSTYSAHPFNIMVSELGVNTHSTKITVGITVVADDVVAALIDAGQFGLRNYSLQDTANADKEYTPHWKKFVDGDNKTNGLKGYVDLTGSLDSTVLTNNLFANVGAYIKVNAGYDEAVIINSFSKTDVYPLAILTAVNNNASDYTPEQKTKMVEMLENNAYLKEYCDNFLTTDPIEATLSFADVANRTERTDETQIWTQNGITLTNNKNTSTTDIYNGDDHIRLYKNSTVTVEFAGMTKITFACKTKAHAEALVAVIGSNAVIGENNVVTVMFDEPQNSFEVTLTEAQVQLNSITVSTCAHSYDAGTVNDPTCTDKGYTTFTCTACGGVKNGSFVDAKGHSYTAVVTAPTCGADGYTTYTCTNANCGDSYISDKEPATGEHTYVDGICSVCGTASNVSEYTNSMGIIANKGTLAGDSLSITWVGEYFTATGNKGTSSTAIRITDSDHFRVYAGSTFTIAGNNGAQISKIVITCVSGYVPTFTAQNGVTYETDGTTITVRLATPVDSITLSASAQWRLSKIEVTYLSTPPCEHEGGTATCTSQAICSKCGNAYGDTAEHAWGDPVVVEPTCTEAGSSTTTCSVCGETETTTLLATGHKFGTDGVCTNDGCDVTQSTTKSWQKADSIAVGDIVTLVYEKGKMELSAISTTSTKYGIGVAYTDAPTGVMQLTVVAGSTTGTYAFQTEDGKYLYWTSGNSLNVNTTLDAKTSWTVTFSDGNVIIKNVSTTSRQIFWNASSPRFACYTSAQTAIQLYAYK